MGVVCMCNQEVKTKGLKEKKIFETKLCFLLMCSGQISVNPVTSLHI